MRNIVFDLGAVLLEWNPDAIIRQFTSHSHKQNKVRKEIFQHPDWLEMDRGQLSEDDAIGRAVARTGFSKNEIIDLFYIVKDSLTIIPDSLRVLEQASNKGLSLYCLSNMSPENYSYLKQKYDFFNYFHGIVISGLENTMKPEKEIYEILLQRFALNPNETLFIDDREENTRVAAGLGISTITFSPSPKCYSELRLLIAT